MSQPQQNVSISAPGFAGLNTQDSPLDMDPSFASIANNCVIDKFGRISSRRGFNFLTTNPQILNGNPIVSIEEYVDGVTGDSVLFATGDLQIFRQNKGSPDFDLVPMVLPNVPTADNWQMVTFNDKMYFVQANHKPLVYDPLVSTTDLQEWDEYPPNIADTGTDGQPNCVHAAFGRLWVSNFDSNSTVVAWSGILDGEQWTTGGAGSLQTAEYWPSGFDEIVALAAHNNFMIFFGKNNILLYQTTSDVLNTINLIDTVEGIGCIARDSVVPTGTDFMFIDSTGVRSLNRTVQEKSIPIGDVSKNIRQEFQQALRLEPDDNIKAVYHNEDSFYACFLPSNPKTYVLDTWAPLQDGSFRATVWINIRPRCGVRTVDRTTYFAGRLGVFTYEGAQDTFLDPDNSFEEATESIFMEYYTHPLDFGSAVNLIFPKQVDVTLIGGSSGELAINWGYDYKSPTNRKVLPLPQSAVGSLWGEDTSEWDTNDQWTSEQTGINQLKYNIWGSGRNISVGFDTKILGSTVSIQELNIQVLQGRIL